jgi:chaperonin GroES
MEPQQPPIDVMAEQGQKDDILNEAAAGLAAAPPQTSDGEQLLTGLAQAELTGRIKNAAETYNLAKDLDEGMLREIGQEVFNGLKDDEDSRADWLDQHAFWLSLYMQDDYAENSDAERSWGATESVPILTEACNSFQSRTYKIFFPNDTFVSAIPMRRTVQDRKALEDRADRIGRHMSYQLGFQDRSYKQDKDALFLGAAVHGSFFTKAYFSEKLRRFKVDNIRPTDLIVPYNVGPARIEDLRRKSHVIYTTVGQTEDAARQGFLLSPAIPCQSDINKVYNVKVDDSQGLREPNASNIKRDGQAILIEQHVYLDLDGSGEYRPYIVTIDLAKNSVKRLTIGYEADMVGNPLKDYEQVQYFTHYKYQENPDGFYGLGLGHSIGDLNSAVNIMLRQSMDAATLANDGNSSGFISEKLGINGDEIRMVLGKYTKVPDTIGDFKNSIMTMQFPGPNAALIQIMEALDQRAQRLGSVTEATTGTPEKVIQPTTYLAQIEQALEQFSSVQMRLANSLSEELQKIYKINQRYLPLVDYFVVNGAPETISRVDYADDMLIQPIFDPKYATQSQKVARAQAELEATMQNPVNQGRPQVYDEAFKRYLEALEVEDIELLIPPQPQVENFDNQFLENMFFLMPQESRPPFDVFPDQNHQQHLAILQQFVAQYGQTLQPDQVEAVTKHHMKHEAYLYGQQHGVVPTQQTPTPPLAARNGNQMGNAGIESPVPQMAISHATQDLGAGPPVGGPTTGA